MAKGVVGVFLNDEFYLHEVQKHARAVVRSEIIFKLKLKYV